MLVRVFYVSEIAAQVSEVDIRILLGSSQINNRRLDITGVLVITRKHFAQVLEGRPEAVDKLLPRILNDPRHHAARVLFRATIVTRQFAAWSLGSVSADEMMSELSLLHRDGTQSDEAARRLLENMTDLLERRPLGLRLRCAGQSAQRGNALSLDERRELSPTPIDTHGADDRSLQDGRPGKSG